MLTGKELGAAIESARIAKGVSKKKLAEDFGVKPPSVQGWVNTGRINKSALMRLMDYFSDVAGPEHWGLSPQMASFISQQSENLADHESEHPCTPHENATGAELAEADAESIVDLCDDQVAELLGKLRAAKKKASPRSQAVISRMIGLAERAALDDAAWKLIDDLLTELSKK